MSQRMRMFGLIVIPTVILMGGILWAAGKFFRVGEPERPPAEHNDRLGDAKPASMDEALKLIHAARDRFANVKDYSCTYLRDEFIDNEMSKNHIILKIRHEPFSVHMEWLDPKSKRGRKAIYVKGQNDGKMIVDDVIRIRLNPEQSVKMKESRHTILEIGLQNMINRFCDRWQKEKELGLTEVTIREGEVRVKLPDGEKVRPCTCITTLHQPKDKQHFLFYRTLLYIDKETQLPVRMQGHDWPKNADDREGQLLEDYTYLDVKTNVGLKDEDFK